MRRSIIALCIALLPMAACKPQAVNGGRITAGSTVATLGTIDSNGTVWMPGNWSTTNGTLSSAVVCDMHGSCYTTNNRDAETRPLDHKGPSLSQVDESAIPLDRNQLAPEDYTALAREIKFESPSSDEAQVLTTLFDSEFHIYNFEKVDGYLYRQALRQGAHMKWGWKPMRQADLKMVKETSAESTLPETNGLVFPKLYGRRVPTQILADVKCVLSSVPNAVFLISDYEHVTPDPFLAVSTPRLLSEGKLWIIDRWDEPTFDDGKPVKSELKKRVSQ